MNPAEERQMLRQLERIATALEWFNRRYDHLTRKMLSDTVKEEPGLKVYSKNVIDRVFEEAFDDIDKMMEDMKK